MSAGRKFVVSFVAATGSAQRMTHAQARELARSKPGNGYVWMLIGKHWHIVANYDDGAVWNGLEKCVPAKPDPRDDWEYLARAKS